MSESSGAPSWNIERRSADFALVRTDGETKSELLMSEADVLALSRMFPSYARGLVESKNAPAAGVQAWLTIPVTGYQINSDLHNRLVLLLLRDETETEFGFSFTAHGAKQLGERLVLRANWVENAPRTSSH